MENRILAIIPCLNEEISIAETIDGIKRIVPKIEIWVIDNNSSDNTAINAESSGARVIKCSQSGKGFALRRAFSLVKENYSAIFIVDGDATYLSIAAASILAKVEHDKWVIDWCKENTAEAAKYDLVNCKGYGTLKHRNGILKHGYTELHRRLYLRKLIPDIQVSRYGFIE